MGAESRSKPYGYCCPVERLDPLALYDRRASPYKSSLPAITSARECPVSRMRVQFRAPRPGRGKRGPTRAGAGDRQRPESTVAGPTRLDNDNRRSRKAMWWHLEDEIALAKALLWREKQQLYEEESNRTTIIAKKKYKNRLNSLIGMKCPRWYQDLSLKQMYNLMNLEDVMRADYDNITTRGTQTALAAIGVTSTFFKLKPSAIERLHTTCNFDSVDFLKAIYKILTGNDPFEEEYKTFYDCNERIILSAIALLTLPETVKELHARLPAMIVPKLPPRPKSPTCPIRRRSSCPYEEELFKCPDWLGYRNALQKWEKQWQLVARMISPFEEYEKEYLIDTSVSPVIEREEENTEPPEKLENVSSKFDRESERITSGDAQVQYKGSGVLGNNVIEAKTPATFDVLSAPKDDKKYIYANGAVDGKSGVMGDKVYDRNPSETKTKSWLGEKDTRYVTAGVREGLPSQLTYEIAGVARITPSNSDESFFAALKLDKPRKVFPRGRENLSRRWQEWLLNVDEEYSRLEQRTDELLESVRTIARPAFPEPACDSCCACRQTRRTRERWRQTKTPYLLIGNVAQDGEKKYVVGSTVMHSPGPSPTESPVSLLGAGAPRDETGSRVFAPPPPVPVVNIPPCACAIQQMASESVSPSASRDDIPWTKDEGLCPGKKYRPRESGAHSCKSYPGDKSCRRNPFVKQLIQTREQEKRRLKNVETSGVLSDSPAILPEELPTNQCNPEKKTEETVNSTVSVDERDSLDPKRGRSDGRTKSEQESAKRNPAHLCEPNTYPSETLAVSHEKRPCPCKEDGHKRKIPVYNVSGIALKRSDETPDEAKLEEANRVVGGVVYFTPPVSPRGSDELTSYESYNVCVGERRAKEPKKKRRPCGCDSEEEDRKREEARRRLMEGKSPEERWRIALEDAGLRDYFTQRKRTPCWTSCKKFRDGPRTTGSSGSPRLARGGRDNSHRHWEQLGDEAFGLIHGDKSGRDAASSARSTGQETHDKRKQQTRVGEDREMGESSTSAKGKVLELRSANKNIKRSNKRKYQKVDKINHKMKRYKENADEIKQNASRKQISDKAGENMNNGSRRMNDDDGDKKYTGNDLDLMAIIKAELEKLAAEGYAFAKLPRCYLLPQFRDWIAYRKGVVFSENDREKMKHAVRDTWELIDAMEMAHVSDIRTPSLHMTKHQLGQLTYAQFEKLKQMIGEKRAIFHSEVRKARTYYARVMWNTMESGKFPSASFKRVFFTYMASREADGHVYKPWFTSEVRARDPWFSCY